MTIHLWTEYFHQLPTYLLTSFTHCLLTNSSHPLSTYLPTNYFHLLSTYPCWTQNPGPLMPMMAPAQLYISFTLVNSTLSLESVNFHTKQGRHFNFFLRGRNFILFFDATSNLEQQHFICSNLTLFIVPFFLSFFSFFLFFLFLSFFFLSSFSLGDDCPPAPLKWCPWY